jgi:hypothetical protein
MVTRHFSHFDLALCEENTFACVESCSVHSNIDTDHLPVITSLSLLSSMKTDEVPCAASLNYGKFSSALEGLFSKFDSTCNTIEEIDSKISEMENIFKTAKYCATGVRRQLKRKFIPKEIS